MKTETEWDMGRERTDSFVSQKNKHAEPLKTIRLGIRVITKKKALKPALSP